MSCARKTLRESVAESRKGLVIPPWQCYTKPGMSGRNRQAAFFAAKEED